MFVSSPEFAARAAVCLCVAIAIAVDRQRLNAST
jgi:hypothetical protein